MDLARKRLAKELMEVSKAALKGEKDIILVTEGDNLFKWYGYIKGPPDSAFSEGWFKLKFEIGANYP